MTDCRDTNAVLGCFNDGVNPAQTVMITHVHDFNGAPAVVITDLSGAIVAAATAANTTLGACAITPLPAPDVEERVLCDIDPASGVATQFVRRTLTTFSAAGVPTYTVTDLALDGTTAYVTVGTIAECPTCTPLGAADRGVVAAWPALVGGVL